MPAMAQDKTILFSFPKASYPFFEAVRAHAEDEARQLGIQLIFEDGKGDSVDQAADVENTIARGGIDGVLIAPNDVYALAPRVNDVLQQSIPIVTFDTRCPWCFEGSAACRHRQRRRRDGSWPAGWSINFPNGAKMLHLTGLPGSSSGIDRAKGVRDGLAAAGANTRSSAEASANWSRTEGMMVTEGQLTVPAGAAGRDHRRQ